MSKTKMDGFLAAASEDDLDPKYFLGRVVTFTLPDREVKGTAFMRSWAKNGLDVDWLPEARQPVHVFQSACASVRGRKDANGGGKVEIRADEVENLSGRCSYQITRACWDLSERVIDFRQDMRLQFDKDTNAITVAELPGYDAQMTALVDDVQTHFEANAKTVPGQKVRNAVRNTLLRIGAQNLRRKAGGLYFVPMEWNGGQATKPILDGLTGVLTDLYDEDADFYTWPMLNNDGEREMVRKHFMLNVSERLEELTLKAVDRVRSGKGRGVREEMILNLHNDRRKVHAAIAQFQSLVHVEEKDLKANLLDLDDAISKLEALAAS